MPLMDVPEGYVKWVFLVKKKIKYMRKPTQKANNYPFISIATVRIPVGM